jgi:DNA-nicking Smr family endonuclease
MALGNDEKALWGRVIASVTPLHPARRAVLKTAPQTARTLKDPPPAMIKAKALPRKAIPPVTSKAPIKVTVAPVPASPQNTLDGTWDRRITKGGIVPDISVDLHGSGLNSAYARLDGALEQAIAQRMRVILLVTGKARSHDRASGQGRGAIASVVRDWLASSRHATSISAVRGAHPRHGGTGALYIVLKR